MTNISKEKIKKIITDTKEMYLFFSNSTEEEIISLCWNNKTMSNQSYMKLFEMACYTNKPKVVQNFLTKEYNNEFNKKIMTVNTDFLFLSNAIDKIIISENFNIIEIILNHLKLRNSHSMSKMHSYNKKTYSYIFFIFKKFLENDNLFLINNQTSFYNKINFKDKIELVNKAIKEKSPKTFRFLINDIKKYDKFKTYFNSIFIYCFSKNNKDFFDIFIQEMNFNCKDNFPYFIKCLFSMYINDIQDYKFQYIKNNSNMNKLFTYDIFLNNLDNIKNQNVNIIINIIKIPNIKKHITLKWIENNFQSQNEIKLIKNFLCISNF